MTLADDQAALVRALVAGGPPPDGFDAERLATASRALLRKRAQDVGRRYPMLREGCGDRFLELFGEWARDRPKTSTDADARAFAAYLEATGVRPTLRARWRRRLRR